jgi:hypothetical protein
VKLELDLLLLELFPSETKERRLLESGDSTGEYAWQGPGGHRTADDGFVSAVEPDVTDAALLLPPEIIKQHSGY